MRLAVDRGTLSSSIPMKARSGAPGLGLGALALVCATLALVLSPSPARPESPETVVPFDDAGRVVRLTPRQRMALDLWPGRYPHFEEARLLRDADGRERLQIVWRDGADLKQERVELSPQSADSIRAAVSAWLTRPTRDPYGSGPRTLLLSSATVTGLGFYAWAVPFAADLDGRSAVAAGMLAAGASFTIPYFATLHQPVTPGMAQLSIVGMTRGIAYGTVAYRTWHGPDPEGRDVAEAGVMGSIAGGTAGYLWARESALDPGRAHLIGNGSDLGMIAGLEFALALGLEAEEGEPDRSYEYAAVLGGAAVGIAGAVPYGSHRRPTWGDAELIRTTSLVTQGLALAAWDTGTDNVPSIAAAALAGSVLGAVLGDRLTDRPDFQRDQAILIDLCTIAGGALALGGVYLADDDSRPYGHETYTAWAAAGAAAGFAAAYAAFSDEAFGEKHADGARLSLAPRIGLGGGRGKLSAALAGTLRF